MQLIYLFARLPQPKNNGVVDVPPEGVKNKTGPRTRGSDLAKARREGCEKKAGVATFGILVEEDTKLAGCTHHPPRRHRTRQRPALLHPPVGRIASATSRTSIWVRGRSSDRAALGQDKSSGGAAAARQRRYKPQKLVAL